jgi:hypothetical protein
MVAPEQHLPRGLKIRVFAELVGLSESATRAAVSRGAIPSFKVSGARRIPASYLEQLQRTATDKHDKTSRCREVSTDAELHRVAELAPTLSQAERDQFIAVLNEAGASA